MLNHETRQAEHSRIMFHLISGVVQEWVWVLVGDHHQGHLVVWDQVQWVLEALLVQ